MAKPIPVLQIIHVSDLHFCDHHSDTAKLAREARMWRLWLRRKIEKHDLFGWHEGTLDHDTTALRAFEKFLGNLVDNDADWFPDEPGAHQPVSWLIDTGDATTFGDEPSMKTAQARLEGWQAKLGNCPMRTIYGNHDAWPDTQPGVMVGRGYTEVSELQKNRVAQWQPWQSHLWLDPLVVTLPGKLRIECYALDSVSFGWWDNVRAIGRISDEQIDALATAIGTMGSGPVYRILATHHPVAFPYEARDERKWFIQQMVLAHSGRVVRKLRNEDDAKVALRPLIHLLLAGHTHLGMPGEGLPPNVREVYQGELGKAQLQLVAGALLLVRDRVAMADAIGPQIRLKDRKDFSSNWVLDANQQFQILRFLYDADVPDELTLERSVMARVPNDPLGYRSVAELESSTVLHMASS